MVGRLVKDKQVDGLQQEFEYGKASAFTSRQHLHFLCRLLSSEHKCAEKVANLVAHIAFSHVVDGLEHR